MTGTGTLLVAVAKNPILPELKEVFWFLIAFAILFVVMWKKALPGVRQAMNERSEKIRDNLEEAEQVRKEAQGVLKQYKRQLADARDESNRIIEEARETAENLRRDMMQRAEAQVAELRERSREEIKAAQERATSELQSRVGTMAIELAEKVVEQSLNRDANLRLIERYIEQVGSRS
ncbi:MAG TPA: F0F1 ATP synthase subunit B [Acidimicrobiales bacterium]|nr:F0F1 ATP synthase subunit B [Acidimicrobiales bacterium]